MNKKLVIVIIVIVVLIAGIFLALKLKIGQKAQKDTVQNSSPKQEAPSVTTHVQITEKGLLPAYPVVKKGEFIVFENKTDKEIKISLKGAVNIDEFPIVKGKSAAGPVFGKAGNVDVYDVTSKEKLGSLMVNE